MKKLFVIPFLLVIASSGMGQDSSASAPIKWQKYSIPEKKVSISLPKLPVRFSSKDPCRETEETVLYAYAQETVYEFRIVTKSPDKIPKWCPEKSSFGTASVEKRIREIATKDISVGDFETDESGRRISKTKSPTWTRWVIDDLKNKRWFELCITRKSGFPNMDPNFATSLRFNDLSGGIDIGQGSSVTLGDDKILETGSVLHYKEASALPDSDKMLLVAKHKPSYTEAARQANAQGAVILRVTFLSNGGIGSVSVISALPFGLTEQAIAVAKKLVFIPAKVKGTNVTVVRTVEYSFSIY